MNYHIYINAKNISKHHEAAIQEYTKRLSAYCSVFMHFEKHLTLPRQLTKSGHALLILEKGISSESSLDFADYIKSIQLNGISTLHGFIGYDEAAIYRVLTDISPETGMKKMSLSATSLTAETSALLFLEQLYRGYTIIQGKTYHK